MSSNRFRDQSRRIALCGVLSALAVVLLSLGAIPLATFCCPLLAMLCMVPPVEIYGGRFALIFYAAVSILSLLLAPDKEVALLFVFLGYYPALRPRLNRTIHSRLLRFLAKMLLFVVSLTIMYTLAIKVFGMTYIAEEYAGVQGLLAASILAGCLLWFIFDLVLDKFSLLYRTRWHKKLFKN